MKFPGYGIKERLWWGLVKNVGIERSSEVNVMNKKDEGGREGTTRRKGVKRYDGLGGTHLHLAAAIIKLRRAFLI